MSNVSDETRAALSRIGLDPAEIPAATLARINSTQNRGGGFAGDVDLDDPESLRAALSLPVGTFWDDHADVQSTRLRLERRLHELDQRTARIREINATEDIDELAKFVPRG